MSILELGPNLLYNKYKKDLEKEDESIRSKIIEDKINSYTYNPRIKNDSLPSIFSLVEGKKIFVNKNQAMDYCYKKMNAFLSEHLPLKLYYRSSRDKPYEKVGSMTKFIVSKIGYSTIIIPSKKYKTSSQRVFYKLRPFALSIQSMIEEDKKSNINGWSKIFYKTKYGEYKSLKKLFSLECRKSLALPTSEKALYLDSNMNKYIVPNMNKTLIPFNTKNKEDEMLKYK